VRFSPSHPIDTGIRPLIQLAGIRCRVNKRDLVGKVALDARLTRAQAARALDAFLRGIQTSLANGDHVTLSGFGTFGVTHRKARQVRNPRSGRAMEVAAKSVARFAPGADLKTAIRQNGVPPSEPGA
jgi:DNA-binding protein HU-beta